MTTVNRHGDGENGTEVEVSSKQVASIAGLLNNKVACDLLDPGEWIELLRVVMFYVKPHLRHASHFLPINRGVVKKFLFRRECSQSNEYYFGEWHDDNLTIPPSNDFLTVKVVEICEVTVINVRSRSYKIFLDNCGVYYSGTCSHDNSITSMYATSVLAENQLASFIKCYSQIGPLILYAMRTIFDEECARLSEICKRKNEIANKVQAICANIDLSDGHYVQNYPWGILGLKESLPK